MVEIFKTNVEDIARAGIIIVELNTQFPTYRFNFDLSDCDRILRVQTCNGHIDIERIIEIVKGRSFEIALIE